MRLLSFLFLWGLGIFSPFLSVAQSSIVSPPATIDWNTDGKIENIIEFDMKKKTYRKVRDSEGEKFDIPKLKVTVNGEELLVKSVGLHGNSTLDFPRKSYSVSLRDSAKLSRSGYKKSIRRFHLLSLSMDEYYFRNRFAFGAMEKLGLFPLYYTYVELRINGKTQGVYMLVQKPHDYVLKEMGAPALIRRHYYNEIKKTKIEKKNGAQDKKAYMETFEKIYALAKEYKDSTFYDSVNQLLDLKSYFRWMAFNYYVCNGDYTDELYFYALSDDLDIRFGILPWDYDDIFALEPHEGEFVRNRLIGDRLLFSAEDALDRGLARNDKAYSQYLKELAGLMLEMDMESVMEVYEETFRELYPYYADKNIIATSRLDPFGEVGSEGLKKALLESYELLLSRHEAIEHALEEENK